MPEINPNAKQSIMFKDICPNCTRCFAWAKSPKEPKWCFWCHHPEPKMDRLPPPKAVTPNKKPDVLYKFMTKANQPKPKKSGKTLQK